MFERGAELQTLFFSRPETSLPQFLPQYKKQEGYGNTEEAKSLTFRITPSFFRLNSCYPSFA